MTLEAIRTANIVCGLLGLIASMLAALLGTYLGRRK